MVFASGRIQQFVHCITNKGIYRERHLWTGAWDYDKMIRTYKTVKETTGIE